MVQAFATVDEIRNDIIALVRELPGTAVQTYADDVLLLMIRNGFNAAFSDAWWPSYMQRVAGATFDGTTGKVTTTLPYLHYADIRKIWIAGTNTELSEAAPALNPNTLGGTTVMFIEPTEEDGKIFIGQPITCTSSIDIHGRVHPGFDDSTFNADLRLKIDRDLLSFAGALAFAIDDASDPGAIEKFQKMYNERFSQLWPDKAHWTTLAGGRQYPVEWWMSS